jgi:diketogulonate reductase-like aldo/keto reductase
MEYKNLTDEVKIPVIGLGTWGMGGGMVRNTINDEEDITAIRFAIKLGMTHIDTAEMYGDGHCEELVGKAIRDFEREALFITTKILPEHLRYKDVISAASGSLSRLKTNYIDLYLIHWPNPGIPLEETMRAMDYLVEQGMTRFIGVSNFGVDDIKEAQKYSKNKIVANQIKYNLLVRARGGLNNSIESDIVPYCQENNILVIAYEPLAKGKLIKQDYRILDEISHKYNKTRAQIAINWLISQMNVITIPKSSNLEHIKENLGALGWKMKEEDINKLSNKFNDV